MNVQEYITSGIVESYVLGLASAEEQAGFEQACVQYPEVLAARTAFEEALEKQARENAITPLAGLKESVLASIKAENKASAPVSLPAPAPKKINWSRYAAAASLVLLAGSLLYNITLFNQNRKLRSDRDTSMARLEAMNRDLQVLQQNPNIKMASMKGMPASPQSFATVYWDTTSQDVYLLINNMPKPASDKQYQLWAFLNGQPTDMGLIEITEKPLQLYRLKKAESAQAFAITLEKKGRADSSKPGGDVYVMGQL